MREVDGSLNLEDCKSSGRLEELRKRILVCIICCGGRKVDRYSRHC